jgi:vacuolar-type H+-ATPase subunit E/Vma4
MALADILNAIDADMKEHIALLRKQHQQRIAELKRSHEEKFNAYQESLAHEHEKKSAHMQSKANTLIAQRRSQVLTERQHDLLEETYDALLAKLKTLPDNEVEPLLRRAVDAIGKKNGTIQPAKRHVAMLERMTKDKPHLSMGAPIESTGGFLFVSPTLEQDFTFEALVQSTLRPHSELHLTQLLFS